MNEPLIHTARERVREEARECVCSDRVLYCMRLKFVYRACVFGIRNAMVSVCAFYGYTHLPLDLEYIELNTIILT